jgi:hypothetical protein
MFDLLSALAKFEPVNDRENDVAFFRTHVLWIAPEAYLNIIYKPAVGMRGKNGHWGVRTKQPEQTIIQ